jgi:hypothetical protein
MPPPKCHCHRCGVRNADTSKCGGKCACYVGCSHVPHQVDGHGPGHECRHRHRFTAVRCTDSYPVNGQGGGSDYHMLCSLPKGHGGNHHHVAEYDNVTCVVN